MLKEKKKLKLSIFFIAILSLLIFQSKILTTQAAPSFTATEVATHNTNADCWTIISGNVYDVTPIFNFHKSVVTCGGDSTQIYINKHGSTAQLATYSMGSFASTPTPTPTPTPNPSPTSTPSGTYTMTEIATHNISDPATADCWVVVNGGIYDVSSMMSSYGYFYLCGEDNTTVWNNSMFNGDTSIMDSFLIGTVVIASTPTPLPIPDLSNNYNHPNDEDENENEEEENDTMKHQEEIKTENEKKYYEDEKHENEKIYENNKRKHEDKEDDEDEDDD